MATLDTVHDYWNSRPCNVKHSKLSSESVEYYDEVAKKRYTSEPHIPEFMSCAAYTGKKVLELGCGIGTDAIQYAKAGAKITCVDLTENAIALAKENFNLHSLTAEFHVGNIEKLDTFLGDEKFDLIYSFGVIHHTPNPRAVLEQAAKFLNPGGELRMMLYSKISYKLFWILHETGWEFKDAESQIQKYSEAQVGCPVTYTYTFDEVRELLPSEFTIRDIKKDHIFLYDVSEYIKGNFVIDKAFVGVNSDFLKVMKREMGWHTLVVATRC